jgi:hypothetical protein
MEHLQVAVANIATATETVIPVVAPDVHQARSDIGPAYIVGLDSVCTTAGWHRILPQSESVGFQQSGRTEALVRDNNRQPVPSMKIDPGVYWTAYGYQASGGALDVHIITTLRYGRKRPPSDGNGRVVSQIAASDNNTAADTWTRVVDNLWNNAGYELTVGKQYMIRAMRSDGANLIAARLVCDRWNGLKPGVPGYTSTQTELHRFEDCPVFTYPDVISIEAYSEAAEATCHEVEIVEL